LTLNIQNESNSRNPPWALSQISTFLAYKLKQFHQKTPMASGV